MNQDTLMQTILGMAKDISRTAEIVDRHDTDTFPELKKEILETKHAVTRIESKQNQDMSYFHQEKEAIIDRIKPLETFYREIMKNREEAKSNWKRIFWGIMEKISYIVLIGLAGYAFTHAPEIINHIFK